MDWNFPLTPTRLIKVSGLIAFTLTLLVDVTMLTACPDPFETPTTWLPVLVSGPLICLAVLDTPQSPGLGKRVIGVVAISLALTVWSRITPPDVKWWGALETCGLLFLTIRSTAHPWRPATAAAYNAALTVAVLALTLRTGSTSAILVGGYVLTVALAICIAIGCAGRALEARRERAVRDVRQAERLALARDLHDLVAHHMTGIIVQANAALTIQSTAPDKMEPILRNIALSGTETLDAMRRLVHVLRQDNQTPLRPGELLTELADLVSAHSAAGSDDAPAHAQLDITAAARTARLTPEVELSVQRLAQEALTNVRRHAPGAKATVRLDADTTWLHVTITNTAPHRKTVTPVGGGGGFGLLGVRERVETLDGTLRTGPLPQGGWQVQAAFRLAAHAHAALRGGCPPS